MGWAGEVLSWLQNHLWLSCQNCKFDVIYFFLSPFLVPRQMLSLLLLPQQSYPMIFLHPCREKLSVLVETPILLIYVYTFWAEDGYNILCWSKKGCICMCTYTQVYYAHYKHCLLKLDSTTSITEWSAGSPARLGQVQRTH